MPTLSTPIGELQSEYGGVVIGSGYGGAIAAYRMAQHASALGNGNGLPAFSVCVLERGIEREAGDFPSSFVGSLGEIQADTKVARFGRRNGLFDFRINKQISVLVGCGLGGTSLINAGVMLGPTEAVLNDARWPASLRGTGEIEKHFDTVRRALDVNLCPTDVELDKAKWLSAASARLDEQMTPAPIAVSFSTHVNQFNVQQQRCVLCGNCITGCNHSAKNSVAMNYLPGAASAGAAIFCGVETRAIEPGNDGWWLVHVRFTGSALRAFKRPEMVIRARMVFLGAGTLGSTEILLRSHRRYGLELSRQLGRRFTGNGDVIAFSYNTPDRVNGFGHRLHIPRDASVGPTIAAMIDERAKTGKMSGAMIQEGAIPGALGLLLRFGAPIMARATNLPGDTTFDFRFRHIWREMDSMIRGVRHGALARTQTFLAMGHDDGKGQIMLKDDRVRITWDDAGSQKIFKVIAHRLQEITKVMKGRHVINPFWSRVFGRRLMTVHPLGGCCMADDAAQGVVNADGQVFNGESGDRVHEGLYVCDGSIVPTSLGTNPALTISSLAERISAGATASRLLNPPPAPPTSKPGTVSRRTPGIHYAERLHGRLQFKTHETRFKVVLHLSAEDIEDLLESPEHRVRVVGVAFTPDLTEQQWTVSEGSLRVLVDDPRSVDTKLLAYRLMLTSASGKKLWLCGHKVVNPATLRRNAWRVLTRVPFVVYDQRPDESKTGVALDVCEAIDAWDRAGDPAALGTKSADVPRIVAAGALTSTAVDAIRLILSMTIVRQPNVLKRLRWRWRFSWGLFIRPIVDLRFPLIRPTRKINPFESQTKAPVSNPSTDIRISEIDIRISDIKETPSRFMLTHYRGAECELDRVPVVLAPGFGMSADAFRVGLPSIAEYLHGRNYDVWLLDYRGSDRLDISLTQFTLDDLAGDFAEAIDTLHQLYNRRKPIRVVAHCVASLAMQMALLKGGLRGKGLHSVVLSQSFAFIDPPLVNRLKAKARLPDLLSYLNFRPVMSSDFDKRASYSARALDRLLHLYPSDERCSEGVCRRLLLMYGEVIRHDQLDLATHQSLYDMFDRANFKTFSHLAKMFARGHIVDQHGRNTYLTPDAGKRVDVPITLLQGTANGLFRPRGAVRTREWLVAHGGFGPMNAGKFVVEKVRGYGHLDHFIGRRAANDVFPLIAAALERM